MDFLFTVAVIGAAVMFVHYLSERLCRWMEEVNSRLEARWRGPQPYDRVNTEVENGKE